MDFQRSPGRARMKARRTKEPEGGQERARKRPEKSQKTPRFQGGQGRARRRARRTRER